MFREEGDSLLLLSAEDPTLIFLCQPELLHLHLITSVIVPFCHVTVGMQQSSINQSIVTFSFSNQLAVVVFFHRQAAAPRPPPLKTDALKLDSLTCPAGGDSFGCKEMSDR